MQVVVDAYKLVLLCFLRWYNVENKGNREEKLCVNKA